MIQNVVDPRQQAFSIANVGTANMQHFLKGWLAAEDS
jgi:hypothetical protein